MPKGGKSSSTPATEKEKRVFAGDLDAGSDSETETRGKTTSGLSPAQRAEFKELVAEVMKTFRDEIVKETNEKLESTKKELESRIDSKGIEVSQAVRTEFEPRFQAAESTAAAAKETADSTKKSLDEVSGALRAETNQLKEEVAELKKRQGDSISELKKEVAKEVIGEMEDRFDPIKAALEGGGGAGDSAGRQLIDTVITSADFAKLVEKIAMQVVGASTDQFEYAVKNAEDDVKRFKDRVDQLESSSESRVHTAESRIHKLEQENADLRSKSKEELDTAKAQIASLTSQAETFRKLLTEVEATVQSFISAQGATPAGGAGGTSAVEKKLFVERFKQFIVQQLTVSEARDDDEANRKKHNYPGDAFKVPSSHDGKLTAQELAKMPEFISFVARLIMHIATTPGKVIPFNLTPKLGEQVIGALESWCIATKGYASHRSDSKFYFEAILELFDQDGPTSTEIIAMAPALQCPIVWVSPPNGDEKTIKGTIDLLRRNITTLCAFVRKDEREGTAIKREITSALFQALPHDLKKALADEYAMDCSYRAAIELSAKPDFTLETIFDRITTVISKALAAGEITKLGRMVLIKGHEPAAPARGRSLRRAEDEEVTAAAGAGSASSAASGQARGQSTSFRHSSQSARNHGRPHSKGPAANASSAAAADAPKRDPTCFNCGSLEHKIVQCERPCKHGLDCEYALCRLQHLGSDGKPGTRHKDRDRASSQKAQSASSQRK